MDKFLRVFTLSMVVAVLLSTLTLFADGVAAQATPKVSICHRSNSVTNPYESETVDVSSADGIGPGPDHMQHTGPVAVSQVVAQALKDSHQDWGDIVPPTDNDGNPMPAGGLNWSADGQAIWRNACNYVVAVPIPSTVPTATPTGTPTLTPTPTPTSAPTIVPTSTPTVTPTPTIASTSSPALNCPDGTHLNLQGTKCLAFELGGPQSGGGSSSGGQVLGASTVRDPGEVLGAHTLGATGSSYDYLGLSLVAAGTAIVVVSGYEIKKTF